MVQISTSTANDRIDMRNPDLVDFQRNLIAGTTNFSWFTDVDTSDPPYADVGLIGTGFTYSGSGNAWELAGGTISRISIDVGNDNSSWTAGDLVFTDTGALIGSNIDKDDPASFWREVLKGNDTFDLTGLSEARVGLGLNVIFGDDLSAALGPTPAETTRLPAATTCST